MAEEIKSPQDMTDEELNAYLGIEEDKEEKIDKPEEKPEQQEKQEAQKEDEQEEEKPDDSKEDDSEEENEEDEEEKPISRRKQARLDKLAKIWENIQGEGKSEEEPSKPKKPEALKYEDDLDADDEVIKKLNDDREKFGQAMYEQGLEQARALKQQQDAFEFKQMLKSEEPQVRTKYKFMDPADDKFNQELTDSVVKDYLHFTSFDPNTGTAKNPISYFDFVDARMQQVQALAEEMVSETQQNVVKQAANTGLRPSGSAPSKSVDLNKMPYEMSDEELDAIIKRDTHLLKRR